MSEASFQQGEGSWLGSAEVYDASGSYAGEGHDSRVVRRDLEDGTVEVTVSFDGPFRLSGTYVIADHGDHRLYLGPLNHGHAEAFGDRLIDTNNYWPDVGLSQRFFLMVLPDGRTQLSLALLSRGEQPAYTVVGEYTRRSAGDQGRSAGDQGRSAGDQGGSTGDQGRSAGDQGGEEARAGEPAGAGGHHRLLERSGTWSGNLQVIGADGDERGATEYSERVEAAGDGRLIVSMTGAGFTDGAVIAFHADGRQHWTGGGDVVGSETLWGGRALSGVLLFGSGRLRLWRREVVRRDGSCKGVLHTWYRGGTRVGVAHGVLEFAPAAPLR